MYESCQSLVFPYKIFALLCLGAPRSPAGSLIHWEMVVLMVMIYYSERTENGIAEWKGTAGGPEETGVSFHESVPWGVTQEVLQPYEHRHKMLSTRKLIRDSGPTAFIGGWPCRHPLPSTWQSFRLPEGKGVCSGLSDVSMSESLNRPGRNKAWNRTGNQATLLSSSNCASLGWV